MKFTLDLTRVTTRLPHDQMEWLKQKATANLTSINAEISRAIRARMEADQHRSALGS